MGIVEKTSAWWYSVLRDGSKLEKWLIRLYQNEFDAYYRFNDFANKYCVFEDEHWYLFKFLAEQELRHAHMVLSLIKLRGINDKLPINLFTGNSPERYWDCVLPCIVDLSTAAGVGALAEGLSLERMRVIISDPDTPKDIRALFEAIEPDEGVHAKVLGVLAGRHGISSVIDCHSAGLEALGLKLKADKKADIVSE